jgi:predicted unusual protein kinase regulating ubiquinone biosynthesis (AarF/ABC1/UbiB family)
VLVDLPGKPIERLWRASNIGHTAARVWLRYKVPRWYDRMVGNDPSQRDYSESHQRSADQIFETATRLRGLLIKMCQVIGTRSDVFPPAYVRTLSKAQDALPPRDFDEIRTVIEEDFDKPLDAVFAKFEPRPVAAASLAQVHRARLLDGREAAVKIQYPDIEHIVQVDLTSVRRIARIYERFDPQPLELLPLLDELTKHLSLELDFEREADSADRVRELFADDDLVVVPRMHRAWSTKRVLVMELVGGIKITEREAMQAAGLEPSAVMQDLMQVYVRMILAAGFFQADPHPGNLFVRPNRQIVLIDFGLAKELPEGFGLGLFELMFSMMTLNEAAMIRAFQELGFQTRTGDTATFVRIARRMMARSDTGRFEGEFTEQMTDELFEAIREDPVVRVPSDFVLVGRAFSLLSGIAHTLGHRANVLEAMGARTG